ncbi:zinc finger protein 346 isoform X1 [Oryzias melastigma]|uniref:zinc finger protein 346 isoform X1 n=1 Tax=Oryzias melastigma TaxID=30732 RepID=UPI000CF81858|nr:zinc finger protein 346 isoform X1 [Oryzias melastigma]
MAGSDDILCLSPELEKVHKMILEKEDLFSLSFCKVCSAVLLSKKQRLSHYTGRKHANKVRQYISLQNEKELLIKKQKTSDSQDGSNGDLDRTKACQLCNTIFTSKAVAESHYQGKFHAKRLKLEMTQVKLAGKASMADLPKEKPGLVVANVKGKYHNPERFCSICDASFNNPLMAQQHYKGRKHKKRMTRAKLMETYGFSSAQTPTLLSFKCVACNIEVNSISQYQSHLSGAKHRNQMKKSGGKNTTENQQSPEHTQGGSEPMDDQYTPADDRYTPANDQYTPANDRYTPADDEYTPADGRYTPANDRYTPANVRYTPADNRYTPADDHKTPVNNRYTSLDDQYTPGDDQYTPGDDQYTPGDDQYTPGDDQYTLADDQYGSDEEQYCIEDEQCAVPYQYTLEDGEFSELPQYT